MFTAIPKNVSFPEIEKQVLAWWQQNRIFEKSLEARKNSPVYTFYDGPPFATGLPHYGHLLAGTLKDVVPRYWTMKGKYVERRFGWDCHGLPVENEMEKELKISGKKAVEEYGIDRFNEACRSIVLRYTKEWRRTVERMGRWVDFDNDYKTMNPDYMESIWWVFKQLWEKELIYRGHRVQPYCPRCSTTLSNFETNQGYRDAQDPSITITFPVVGKEKTFLLAWTTTPWTLPSNVALAVGPDIEYVEVEDNGSRYIIAQDRLAVYYKKPELYKVIRTYKGSELVGLRYVPLFTFFKDRSDSFFQVTSAPFVSTEDGTGIVHIAPAFGEDDYEVGAKLNLPLVSPVDEEGKFTSEVPNWEGRFVKEADKDIIRALKEMGRLIHQSTMVHSYPHCYRCDTPLIYKAISTWFMKIEPVKQDMIASNNKIHWVPEHLQKGRFGNWLENARDWNLSRNRYWGNPIPVWECSCGHKECVGSIDELNKLTGGNLSERMKNLAATFRDDFNAGQLAKIKAGEIKIDLHKHFVDALELACPKCNGTMKRTPEVLDCWFESGSMPYAQLHYPFENKTVFEKGFPADFIAEGLDQTRGWFYTLTVLSSALFKKPAFQNVVVNGIILAADGKKLSKRLRNYLPPDDILDAYGADALRLFLIDSPAVKAEDLRFSEAGVKDMVRAVILPLWNAYSFFTTYANIDGWTPAQYVASKNDLDRWIQYQLQVLTDTVEREMNEYHLYNVVPAEVDFVNDLTNWYIRRSRRRFWKSENDGDKISAYSTLYFVLVNYCKILAPFFPFLSDHIFRNLTAGNTNEPESVHLCDYPTQIITKKALADDRNLWIQMNLARNIVAMGRSLREEHEIKTRQPLAELTVICPSEELWAQIQVMSDLIAEELNVKAVSRTGNETDFVTISAKPNFKVLGRLYGKDMPAAKEAIGKMSVDDVTTIMNGGSVTVLGVALTGEHIEVVRIPKEGIVARTESFVLPGVNSGMSINLGVALQTRLSPELVKEGLAREFVHTVQNMRKENGLEVSDRITVCYEGHDDLKSALEANNSYVCSEVLAVEIKHGQTLGNAAECDINGMKVKIMVAKA